MYSTVEALEEEVTKDLAIQLIDDEGEGSANTRYESRMTKAITKADTEINAVLEGLTTVPYTDPPQIIQIISVRIAAENLWMRRSKDGVPETVTKRASWARSMLGKIEKREIQLGATEPVKGGERLTSKTDDDRVFNETMFGKMP